MSHARMRSVTNYFIVNLSIADILNATLNVIPNFTYMLTGNWPFGKSFIHNMYYIFYILPNNNNELNLVMVHEGSRAYL